VTVEVRRKRPVAVVALGDPTMEDDGVALRVMGRVRPLLGEIALCGPEAYVKGSSGPPTSGPRLGQTPAWLRAARASTPRSGSKEDAHALSSIVDWMEGNQSLEPLHPMLQRRRRIVLLVAARHGASPGGVQHWHVERDDKVGLTKVLFYSNGEEMGMDDLPFWMEPDLPEHGTDLIAIEPYRVSASKELSPVLRARLSAITAQVGGLLVRILEEEGWRFGTTARKTGSSSTSRRRGKAA
jgi:hypothetical protein